MPSYALHPMLLRRFIARQLEIVLQLTLRLRITLPGQEIRNQAFLHRKCYIVVDVLVPPIENLGDDRLVSWRGQDKVNMGRSPCVPVEELQKLAGWTIQRYRVLPRQLASASE